MNVLKLEKRGCYADFTDIENYRVGVYTYSIKGKDGKSYILEFVHGPHYNYRTTHKYTGKPLKKHIRETIIDHGLFIDTQYENDKGCWRNSKLELEVAKMHLPFTIDGILKAVNYISAEKYDSVEFV